MDGLVNEKVSTQPSTSIALQLPGLLAILEAGALFGIVFAALESSLKEERALH